MKFLTLSSPSKSLTAVFIILLLPSCAMIDFPIPEGPCNIQAYIDEDVNTFISKRFQSKTTPRIAVIPFDVPANFAPIMEPQLRLGLDLAVKTQSRFLEYQEVSAIAEVFNYSNYPSKSMDFSTGNYIALESARNAGYDFILIGKLFPFTDDTRMRLQTKIIDTNSGITVWFAETETRSHDRPARSFFNFLSRGVYPERDDVFNLQPRFDFLVRCTMMKMLKVKE